jgi:hypothetical protein
MSATRVAALISKSGNGCFLQFGKVFLRDQGFIAHIEQGPQLRSQRFRGERTGHAVTRKERLKKVLYLLEENTENRLER